MIRIREIRESLGMSSNELARRANTTGATIRRLETGAMELTVSWMIRIADALDVAPQDLISMAAVAGIGNDAVPVPPRDAVAKALALRKITVYQIMSDAVSQSGILPGEEHPFDESPEAVAAAKAGDIVLVKMRSPSHPDRTGVRVFVPPALLVTNRARSNSALSLTEKIGDVEVSIAGVLVR